MQLPAPNILSRAKSLPVASRAIAQALFIPAYVTAIQTDGYYAAGDGGGAYYTRANNVTIGGFTTADGAMWRMGKRNINAFQFGAKGDGVFDDTTALRNLNQFCYDAGVDTTTGRAPVKWRITDSITSAGGGWDFGGSIAWFNVANPEAVDMRAMLRIANTNGRICNVNMQGPHAYNVQDASTYVNNINRGPQGGNDGWYADFFKNGCAAIELTDFSQPEFVNVWTSGGAPCTFKVGIFYNGQTGHVRFGPLCRHSDLIGWYIKKNGDDFMWSGEPRATNNFASILFGTSDLNGSFNGGLGIRDCQFYSGAAPYGILQMYDHGPYNTPLPNPALPISSIYGSLDGSFFEFIGEAALQTLSQSVTYRFTWSDVERFSWDKNFGLPDTMAGPGTRRRQAIKLGAVGDNVKIGTVRTKSLKSPYVEDTGDKYSIFVNQFNGGDYTEIARNLYDEANIIQMAPGAQATVGYGKTVKSTDALVRPDLSTVSNKLADPYNVANWGGAAQPVLELGAPALGTLPVEMKRQVGANPQMLTFSGVGLRQLLFVDNPDSEMIGVPFFFNCWVFQEDGGTTLLRFQQTNNGGGVDPFRYATTVVTTGRWIPIALGNGKFMDAAGQGLHVNLNASAKFHLVAPMASIGIPQPFVRGTPSARKPLTMEAGATIVQTQILAAMPVYANEAAATAAGLVTGRTYQTATGELRIKL